MNLDSIGQRLYGGAPTSLAAPPGAANPSTTSDVAQRERSEVGGPPPSSLSADDATAPRSTAERLYGPPRALPSIEVPPEVARLRSEAAKDPATRLYGDNPTPDSELTAAFAAAYPHDAPMAKAMAIEHQRMAQDIGADGPDIAIAVQAIRKHASHPLSDADEAALSAKASEALDRAHGADAPRVRQSIRALLDRDPRLSKQLIDTGAIFEPNVFLALGQLAERQRISGRLTLK